MKVTIIGCGRWGSLITWYLDRLGHDVTLYGRASSRHMQGFLETRRNDLLTLPESVALSTDIACVKDAEVIIVSIDSQGLRRLLVEELAPLGLKNKIFVLCMKGLEIGTGKRLSEIVEESVECISKKVSQSPLELLIVVKHSTKRGKFLSLSYSSSIVSFMIRFEISLYSSVSIILKVGETPASEKFDFTTSK